MLHDVSSKLKVNTEIELSGSNKKALMRTLELYMRMFDPSDKKQRRLMPQNEEPVVLSILAKLTGLQG